jgi:hypothetical protein
VQRIQQIILIVSTVLGSWLGMQAAHELGHVVGAWLTGGQVARVVLYPLTISRTDFARNPSPLVVVWAGPVIGVVLPLALWGGAVCLRCPEVYLPRFFAGFCLLANGAYIGGGSFYRVGDAGEMLRHGSPSWLLWSFGALTVPLGLCLWHQQGRYFGFGQTTGRVNSRPAFASLAGFVALILLGLVVGGE